MEVCVDTLESALNAFYGQAKRIELCSSLNEGGLTPTYGLFKSIRNHLDKIDPEHHFKINCMIRLRAGDFNYTDSEMESMMEDAKKFIELDTDGTNIQFNIEFLFWIYLILVIKDWFLVP